jgi:hypothetical protein
MEIKVAVIEIIALSQSLGEKEFKIKSRNSCGPEMEISIGLIYDPNTFMPRG